MLGVNDSTPRTDPGNPVAAPRIRQGWLALAGVGVAAVLAVSAFGVWILAPGLAAEPISAADSTSGAQSAPDPTPAPAGGGLLNYTFKSESGNLRCSIGIFSGQPGAVCQQMSFSYVMPSDACPGGAEGVFVGVRPSGAYWPCVSHWREPVDVLPYDTPLTQAGVTCVINYVTGVRCANEDGLGFTMEYDAGISTF